MQIRSLLSFFFPFLVPAVGRSAVSRPLVVRKAKEIDTAPQEDGLEKSKLMRSLLNRDHNALLLADRWVN